MNPYRQAFYQKQAAWHGYRSTADVLGKHEARRPYYAWYCQGWLPADRSARCLDIACGAGQFVYFLKKAGYENVTGLDLDAEQVRLAREAGLPCEVSDMGAFLRADTEGYDVISMLDVLEHLTLEELYENMTLVAGRLNTNGVLIVSVPNANSPGGFDVRHNDITHELSFTKQSLTEMLFCHDLKLTDVRDPWPTPIDFPRKVYRALAMALRRAETLKYRAMGIGAPEYWSPVIWARAVKSAGGAAGTA